MPKNKQVILGVTAGVAIYKACDLVRRLRDSDVDVTVIMTENAKQFISPRLFEAVSAMKVYSGLFEEPVSWDIEHVALAEKADLVLIAPATANCIAKISAGICDDLLTCVVCATKAPVMICPAMNEQMFLNKITQANIERLTEYGYHFVQPRKGRLACGKTGTGCLAEVEAIVKEAQRLLC